MGTYTCETRTLVSWRVSAKIGYTRPRTFADNVQSVCRCGPSRLCQNVDASELIERAIDWLCQPYRRRLCGRHGGPNRRGLHP
jgi:hypothetical protein